MTSKTSLALVLSVLAIGTAHGATVTSNFEIIGSGVDGWTSIGNGGTIPRYRNENIVGNPLDPFTAEPGPQDAASGDGFIRMRDESNQFGYFSAPAVFLGAKSSFYGGTLEFALRTFEGAQPVQFPVTVVLVGTLNTVVNIVDIPTDGAWEDFSFALIETFAPGSSTGWRIDATADTPWESTYASLDDVIATQAEMQAILGNLQGLYITADHSNAFNSGNEFNDLDNVVLSDAPAPPTSGVPEPSSLLLCGLGFAGMLGYRRRKTASA